VLDVIVLGWVGAQHPEGTPLLIGRLATIYYFAHFIIILPFVGWFERPRPLPESISKPVLKSGAAATEAAE
jgi:quinol-cytochrome oxidoreductase complex cytochrome b subunit